MLLINKILNKKTGYPARTQYWGMCGSIDDSVLESTGFIYIWFDGYSYNEKVMPIANVESVQQDQNNIYIETSENRYHFKKFIN